MDQQPKYIRSNVNYNLFGASIRQKYKSNNPFLTGSVTTNKTKKEKESLVKQLQNAEGSNAFWTAINNQDPHAVWGITSQIRIAS